MKRTQKQRFTAQYRIKIAIQLFLRNLFGWSFMLTANISLKSVAQQGWKIRMANQGAKLSEV